VPLTYKVSYGTCYSKSSGTLNYNLYVTNATQTLSIQSVVGSLDYPFDNLMDAIEKAFEVAANTTLANVTIHMEPGIHYLVRTSRSYYSPFSVDRNS
jgi:hypothetical protein